MNRWLVTIVLLIGSAILNHWIPFSSFFRNLDTMVHEFGHALATLLVSGRVQSISLFANHSGVTYSLITAGWRVVPVSLAGYVTASLFSVYLFYTYSRGRLGQGLLVCSIIAAICLLLFVRNSFGMAWIAGFMVVNAVMMLLPIRWLQKGYYLLVAFVSLEESVVGPIGLTVMALNNPAQAGDATGLQAATGVPAAAWGLAFSIVALLCARSAIGHFLGRRGRRGRSRRAGGSRPGYGGPGQPSVERFRID
ncbi:M50 family metallopeptidase [Paenibacillus sp. HJGM_3]|uniref:M50 family metallopeptidase n=1 Tax=Paenibacillus sp. HJGM_3 TaxID=3379816 RepID=UPI00385C55F6